ncbi:MAG: adenylate/guanylate cyclase domain-containing protein, partial [Bdellovibrionales bacterium]|nr:adenylate/guanylate cyclase domain-containing protein [Bdellovibrionales bacterium]
SNDIVIADPGASRVHASITGSETGAVIADLNSLNGTFVNGERLESLRDLTSSDIINIGATKITVRLSSDDALEQMGGPSASRAMTAQMKPVSVSVLLISVADYGSFSERYSTEEVAAAHLRWTAEVREIILELDGTIDKVIRGTVVALWIGSDQRNQALRAARALQKVLEKAKDFERPDYWRRAETDPWRVTAVLSSGLGLRAALGANSKQSQGGFTVIGDPVNHAFELERLLPQAEGNVLVDKATSELIQPQLQLELVGSFDVGGRSDKEQLYSLV